MDIMIKDLPVIYINLARQSEREKSVLSILKELAIDSKNIFKISATDAWEDDVPVYDAITQSHIKALELAKEIKSPVLVLEDDIILKQKRESLSFPDNTDAIFLGVSSAGNMQYDRISNSMSKINYMLAAHAILYMTESYKDDMISLCKQALEESIPHDLKWAMHQYKYNVYAYNKPIFSQHSQFKITNIELEEGTKK